MPHSLPLRLNLFLLCPGSYAVNVRFDPSDKTPADLVNIESDIRYSANVPERDRFPLPVKLVLSTTYILDNAPPFSNP